MKEIWDDLNRRYRDRIVVVLSVALAPMVGGFALSTVTATREANNAVIEFQNSIIARQKAVIESEDRVTVAAAKLTKAEADLAVVTKKLDIAGQELKEVIVALKDARTKFDDLAKSAPKK